ncbi:hypothetical protein NKH77_50140 [Streptomyces sp. M19]
MLRRALESPEISDGIGRHAGAVTVEDLRAQALQASSAIAADASAEYRAYLRLREAAATASRTVRSQAGPGEGRAQAVAPGPARVGGAASSPGWRSWSPAWRARPRSCSSCSATRCAWPTPRPASPTSC